MENSFGKSELSDSQAFWNYYDMMYVCPYPKTYLGGVMYYYNAIWQLSNKMEKQKLINSQTGSTFEAAAVSHIIQPFLFWNISTQELTGSRNNIISRLESTGSCNNPLFYFILFL